jgi:uncharacterized damage-inducible protein DinB
VGMIEPFIMEFQYESAQTRKMLERVPDDKWDWQPHEKSMTMGRLASHMAESHGWAGPILETDEMNLDDSYKPYEAANKAEMLAAYDKDTADAEKAMTGQNDEHLMKTWALKMNGESMFSMPRIGVLRTFIISHMIHHRAQLGLYLRLNDTPVPSIYGPSADEQG